MTARASARSRREFEAIVQGKSATIQRGRCKRGIFTCGTSAEWAFSATNILGTLKVADCFNCLDEAPMETL